MQYQIPSHCETAIIFEASIMLVFEPIVVPFRYTYYESNAEDFFTDNCLDCSLRSKSCQISGARNNACALNRRVEHTEKIECVQMPLPKHMLLFALDGSPKFFYEDNMVIRPLRLGNIGACGYWCNGDVRYEGKDPSSIYNGYMNSLHNSDLTGKSGLYNQYIQEVVLDFNNNIISGDFDENIDIWGDIQDVVHKPTSIMWSRSSSVDFYKIEGYSSRVKIQ